MTKAMFIAAALLATAASAQEPVGQTPRAAYRAGDYPFQLFVPRGYDADIDVSACDRHDDFRTVVFFKRDADLRVAAKKVGEIVGQIAVRGVRVGPQADMAANAGGERRKVGVHLFELREDLPRVTQQRFAGARQRNAACLPLEECSSECLFELPDAVAGRRRGEMHTAGAVREVLRLGNSDE